MKPNTRETTNISELNTPQHLEKAVALDEALVYLESQHQHVVADDATLKEIRRKVDWHISPFLACCYLVQNLDKFALNARKPCQKLRRFR